MATDMIRNRSNVTPLILRIAVAGALAFAGAAQLQSGPQPLPVDQGTALSADPEGIETLPSSTESLSEASNVGLKDKIESAIADKTNTVLSTAHADSSGVEVKMGWQEFTGLAELSFAAVLLIGAFIRLTSLVGVGASAMGTLAGTGVLNSDGALAPLAGMYDANPLAFMLLGAVCLTLLCSGSGPLSLDRLMFGRRKVAEAAA